MTANHNRPTALVTGGRRGIGRGICYALADCGFDLAVNDLEADVNMTETLQGIRDRSGQGYAVIGDIADLDAHQHLLDSAVDQLGRIDCLVNNAGVSVLSRGDLLDMSVESYDRNLNINLRGTFFLTQRFAKYLLSSKASEHHRSIVTISSVNAEAVSVDRGEYCIAKTGLSMMTKLFALRLAEDGIGVYEVRPGVITTDMTIPAAQEKYDELVASGGVPIPRWGHPDDIGHAVASLASGALLYCVGQAVAIDGGLGIKRL